jgi:hypothetical protein
MSQNENNELLTPAQAAALLDVSERWLPRHSYVDEEEYREKVLAKTKPIFPRYKIGKFVRYKRSEILAAIGSR